jgi:hypothetical protein
MIFTKRCVLHYPSTMFEDACRAYVGIVWCLLDEFRLDEAEPFMTDALELSEHAEFIGFLAYLHGCRAG